VDEVVEVSALTILKTIITQPVPLLGWLNFKHPVEVDIRDTPEVEELRQYRGLIIGAWRVWFPGFATSFPPFILVDDNDERTKEEVMSARLIEHEWWHSIQMLVGGVALSACSTALLWWVGWLSWWWLPVLLPGSQWLLSYGLLFLLNLPWVAIWLALGGPSNPKEKGRGLWYVAYRYVLWELDARRHTKAKGLGWG
jgi:hypothetical protein